MMLSNEFDIPENHCNSTLCNLNKRVAETTWSDEIIVIVHCVV